MLCFISICFSALGNSCFYCIICLISLCFAIFCTYIVWYSAPCNIIEINYYTFLCLLT